MRNRLLLPGILLLALAAPGVSGCALRHTPPPAETGAPEPPKVIPALPPAALPPAAPPHSVPAPAPPATGADNVCGGGMAALQEGGYERAMELFSAALKEQPGHPEASKGFDEALVSLKKNGDAAYAQGKPEDAGKRWTGTLRYLNHPAAKGRTYPFTRSEVQAQVNRLTAAQMEKGLLNYRKGDIPAAITAWKTILAYDLDNEEAARSIRTASTQLENLKKIPPSNSP